MQQAAFDRVIWIAIGVLGGILAGVILVGITIGIKHPIPAFSREIGVGVWGPIGFEFSVEMQRDTVEQRLSIEPEISGDWRWVDSTLTFYPDEAMSADRIYTLSLMQGSLGEDGRKIHRSVRIPVPIRQPQIVYLAPARGGAEVWRVNADGSQIVQLTDTGGRVYDYSTDRSGEHIIFSADNDSGGRDLWEIDRDGDGARQLLDCEKDWCCGPVRGEINDHANIIYQRTLRDIGDTEIWIFDDLTGQSTALLQADGSTAAGHSPSWSPDGSMLAYYDTNIYAIQIIDVLDSAGKTILLESNSGMVGAWSSDGRSMVYANIEQTATGSSYVNLFKADLIENQVTPLFDDTSERVEYSLPAYSSDGDWFAIARRYSNNDFSKQIWVYHMDGGESQAVTENPSDTHASYSWDPGGSGIVFQRLDINASSSVPSVVVWRQDQNAFLLIAEDAYLPSWLP